MPEKTYKKLELILLGENNRRVRADGGLSRYAKHDVYSDVPQELFLKAYSDVNQEKIDELQARLIQGRLYATAEDYERIYHIKPHSKDRSIQ